MTSQEFVVWFKGFIDGGSFHITPKQWDMLKEKLNEVDDSSIKLNETSSDPNTFRVHDYPLYSPNWHTINTRIIGEGEE
jgi:hypothetical protein